MKLTFDLTWLVTLLLAALFGAGLLGGMSGCVNTAEGSSAFGFRQSTEWEFYQETGPNSDGDMVAKSSTNWDSLFGWLRVFYPPENTAGDGKVEEPVSVEGGGP